MRSAVLLLLLCQAVPAMAQEGPPAAAVPADAYRDARARDLVELARARRAVVDTRISAYEATAHERLSGRIAAAGMERLLFRRETVSRIAWSPDTVRIELLGAREVQPMATAAAQLPPPDLAGTLPALAFDPVDSEMLLRLDSTVMVHPLAPGSEAHYRFSSGDSSSIRLPDGRVVRLVELRIAARRADPRLINGSFWLDADTHAVVRAGFRLSRAISATASRVAVLTPEVTAELDHVAIDYGLWDLHWWLPRSVVARGVVQAAGVRFPIAYERSYFDFVVQGDTARAAAPLDAGSVSAGERPCRRTYSGSLVIGGSSRGSDAGDSAWNAAWSRAAARVASPDTARSGREAGCDRAFLITLRDGTDLVRSPVFEADIYDEGEGPVDAAELAELARLVRGIPQVPWGIAAPRVRVLATDLIRYNRVEGLSLGALAVLPLGPVDLQGELRAGTTGEIGARLSGIRSTARARSELAVYRGVEATAIGSRPFSLMSSAGGLLLGRDENDYFRGTGVELRLSPPAAWRQAWDVRLFAERQAPLSARSTFSIRGVFDEDFEIRDNLVAEPIDQAGAAVRVRTARGDDPARTRTSAELELHGETGDRTFLRPLLRVGADRLFGARAGVGLALTAGTGLGDVPAQRAWQIGGASTVRGHDPASLRGESLWLARGELTWGRPTLRLAAFGDAGWAGEREHVRDARPLRGAGVGVSLLDNLVRLDLARGLGGGGYRLHLRVGAGL